MLKLLFFETVRQLKLFVRRPAAMFFVVVLPALLLVIFTELFGNEEIAGLGITTAQLHTPTLAVFGAVMGLHLSRHRHRHRAGSRRPEAHPRHAAAKKDYELAPSHEVALGRGL